ncbi:MAG TPA: carboxymuconolactone decarboxylase family protein [Symbiobacteriaceae bacterium]|nr:carboxymuconolactone decarboxylase family protein [Symbiobacteriaceae bacterium]
MQVRLNYHQAAPEGLKQMFQQETYLKTTSISPLLQKLIKVRASQLNGCAYCLDMHTHEARALGESQQRLDCVSAWRECPFYTEAERVALELTEAVTLIATGGVPAELYERVRAHFTESQYVELVLVINQINSWNRIAIATGQFPQER